MSPTDTRDRDPETYSLIGAAMEVHCVLGCGFLENVYHDALALEFGDRGIPFAKEVMLRLAFKGRILPSCYRADFVCYDSVIVEVKAAAQLGRPDVAQMINYLRVSGKQRGLVINFGAASLQFERVVSSRRALRLV